MGQRFCIYMNSSFTDKMDISLQLLSLAHSANGDDYCYEASLLMTPSYFLEDFLQDLKLKLYCLGSPIVIIILSLRR